MNTVLFNPSGFLLAASAGRAAVMVVYLLLLVGILFLPKALREPTDQRVPWWKNLRFWAAVICGVQILVYGLLG